MQFYKSGGNRLSLSDKDRRGFSSQSGYRKLQQKEVPGERGIA